MSANELDDFLSQALACFVNADYHPFGNIEQTIREAIRSKHKTVKIQTLKLLPFMLSQSDYCETRALGRKIQKAIQ